MLARRARLSLVAVMVVAACGSGDSGPPVIVFTKVELPGGLVPVVVSSSLLDDLYVGVRREGRPSVPGLLRRGPDGVLTEIPVRAAGPESQWYSLDSYGEHIVGLGVARGGRASVWTGTVNGIDEQPRDFGGGLVGAVRTRRDFSVLVHTDVVVWTGDGDAWTRHPAAGTEQGTAAAATKYGGGSVLIPGWQDSIPVVWDFSAEPARWTTQRLPDPGRTGTALAAMCWLTDRCAVTGQVDGMLAVWKLADGEWTREAGIPKVAVGAQDRLAAPVESNDWLIQAVSDGGEVRLAIEKRDTWTTLRTDGPTGVVTTMIKVDDTLYLLAGPDENTQTLWQTAGDPLHWRSVRDHSAL